MTTAAAPGTGTAQTNGTPPPAAQTEGTPAGTEAQENTAGAESAPVEGAVTEESVLSQGQKAAARAREDAKRNRERVEAANRQSAAIDQTRQENERLRQENAQYQAWRESLAKDPYIALKQLGMTEEDLARRAITEGSAEQKIAHLHQQLEQERQARLSFEQKIAQDEANKVRANSQQQLVETARDEKKYPHLAQQPDDVIINQTYVTLQRIENTINPETGRPLGKEYLAKMTYDDICFILESSYEHFHSSKASKAASKSKESTGSEKDSVAPEKKPTTKTLTNKLGSQKSVLPKNFDQLPDREQRKLMADQLRQRGMAK